MRAKIKKLAASIGMKFHHRDTKKGPQWNGTTSALLNNGKRISDADLVHEIAHYLVATPEQRLMVNFGLGRGPEDWGGMASYGKEYEICEEKASALGILIEERLGMDWRATLMEHSWGPGDDHRDLPEVNVILSNISFLLEEL